MTPSESNYVRIRRASQLGCALVLSVLVLSGCADDPTSAKRGDAVASATQHTHGDHTHSHEADHDHPHDHGHDHPHGHGHSHGDTTFAIAPQFGGVVARVGDAYAEVVVDADHQLSIHIWSSLDEGLTPPQRPGIASLGVVMTWEHDARVFFSTPRHLELVQVEQEDQIHIRLYRGELPDRYEPGGNILLIAPVVWLHGQRESFDVVVPVPPRTPTTSVEQPASASVSTEPKPTALPLAESSGGEADGVD